MGVAIAVLEPDGILIERTGRGDRDAFEELYRRFARPVLAMARRQLGDYGRAEEAAQETFAAVWRSAQSYRHDRGSGSAWLYAVARHAIIDRARQRVEPAIEVPEQSPRRAARRRSRSSPGSPGVSIPRSSAYRSANASSSSSPTGAGFHRPRSRAISTCRSVR